MMYFNALICHFSALDRGLLIHGIGPKLAYSLIWPNFNTVDPMSIFFGFSESLEKDLSNDVF